MPCTCNPRKLRQEACGDPEEIKGKKKAGRTQEETKMEVGSEEQREEEGRRREGMKEERKS